MTVLAWLFLFAAAALEVGGDAVIRKGLWGNELTLVGVGAVMLAFYGIAVNMVRWDLSKLLGVYVAIFATVAVLYGRFILKENIPPSTWLGLGVIILGGLIIQFGTGLEL
jgi:multidrug transporter EmrE-like cation transporter